MRIVSVLIKSKRVEVIIIEIDSLCLNLFCDNNLRKKVDFLSVCDSVRDIPSCGLRWSYNFHDLPLADSKVPGDCVLALDFGQLLSFGPISFQEFVFLGVGEDHVLRHELVLRDVHEKLILNEHLEIEWVEVLQRL